MSPEVQTTPAKTIPASTQMLLINKAETTETSRPDNEWVMSCQMGDNI